MLLHASIHFPLAREDQGCLVTLLTLRGLQSTSLLRGKTRIRAFPVMPAALQSTSLLRGKTEVSFDRGHDIVLQSTSLLRGKTSAMPVQYSPQDASIHFPLAREDFLAGIHMMDVFASIHFPLAREDCSQTLLP